MKQLRFSAQAETELQEIWLYSVENWSVAQADDYVASIIVTAKRLTEGFVFSRPADHIAKGYHFCASGSHHLYFRVDGDMIVVERIIHQSRDAKAHLGEN